MRRAFLAVGCVLALSLLVAPAQAQTVHWTYVQAGWGQLDPDYSKSQSGPFIGGSFAVPKIPIHVIGDFGSYDDIDVYQIGAGWHGLLGQRADLFADGAFYDVDIEDGLRIRFGVRWMVTQHLELNGYLAWTDLDFSDNRSGSVNAVWNFGGGGFGVGGGYEWGNDFNSARVFARFSFGSSKK